MFVVIQKEFTKNLKVVVQYFTKRIYIFMSTPINLDVW